MVLAAGCAYFNSLYNARRAFHEAEQARWRGQDATADARYREAIDKAAKSYRSDESGRWADDALYLIGRSHAHRGQWPEARAALERTLEVTDRSETAAGARLYLGVVAVATGDPSRGLALLDAALPDVKDGSVLGLGYLWRARASFRSGRPDQGWRSLDEARAGDDRLRVGAELERLTWAVQLGDTAQARIGAGRLVVERSAGVWGDSMGVLAARASRSWGPGFAASLLAGVEAARWTTGARDRLLLSRAQLLHAAGDTAAAGDDARNVAAGVGLLADAARVLLARWRLAEVRAVDELDEVRSLLLPAIGSSEAVDLLESIKRLGIMVERAADPARALALFAAAEMARDVLGARRLARDLFLVYADRDRGAAWEAKALMAAADLEEDVAARSLIQARIDALGDNVYVQAARGTERRETDFTVVEGRLRTALASVSEQVAAEARFRDVLVTETARALDSIRTAEEFRRRLEAGDSALLDSLRLDSLRVDSLRLDSIRLDSLLRDSLGLDSIPKAMWDSIRGDTVRRDTIRIESTILSALRIPDAGARLPEPRARGERR